LGRHHKILEIDNIDKRATGYYYTPEFVSQYISKRLLMLHPDGQKVLDPCVGQEELLDEFFRAGKVVDGYDVIQYKENYRCHFRQKDFIEVYRERMAYREQHQISFDDILLPEADSITPELDYDYFIANPPYNCHEVDYIKKNKKKLQELFADVGVHNMYSMFISALIDVAKEGALIGLITYDSFFTSKAHTPLREKILQKCSIHEVTMCSNDLFHEQGADVRTSILILQKGKTYQGDVFVSNRPRSRDIFRDQLEHQLERFRTGRNKKYRLSDIILQNPQDNSEFIIECPDDVKVLFANQRLGEAFKCVTGISTGKDELYLSKVREDPFIVPFYKNPGKNRFYTENNLFLHKDFLKFDAEIKNFMVRNKQLLYKPGITCSSMGVEFTACRLPEGAAYGVNANIICDDNDAWWLLAYLNSELVTYIVRGILIRSNMITSGYVSRIPLIPIKDDDKKRLRTLGYQAYEKARDGLPYENILGEINEIVNQNAGISEQTVAMIKTFNEDLIKNT